jgi:hypothetical protein
VNVKRRTLLSGCGTVLAGFLAGCGGGSNGDGGGGTTPTPSGGSGTPTPTATPEPTPTPETATETPAPTPTPQQSTGTTHELGEEFTVGEGGNAITYRIRELYRTDRIGSNVNNTTADGTFLIVILEFTNPTDRPVSFPRRVFRLQEEDSWQRFDRDGTQRINADERLNVNQIGDATLNAGKTATGAVAFDVDPDGSYRLWITPTDAETPEHFVPVGEVSSVSELQGSLTG